MPAYDFRCRSCEHVFEISRRATDDALVSCPLCAKNAKRVYTPVGVVFKGSGFHNTDYRTTTGTGDSSTGCGPSESGGDSGGTSSKSCSRTSCSGCTGCP